MYRPVFTIYTAQWSPYVPHSGHYMYSPVVTICTTSLTFSNSTFCPHSSIYVFCVDLRINSHYFPIQHQQNGFYNRDGVCLLRSTDFVFKCNSVHYQSHGSSSHSAVSHRLFPQVSSIEICDGQNGTLTSFPTTPSISPLTVLLHQ